MIAIRKMALIPVPRSTQLRRLGRHNTKEQVSHRLSDFLLVDQESVAIPLIKLIR
ncbi:hypothetical protein [Planctomicrobium sp. SH527]|uniref:hypothetical protein n=1 Tax=Planctomicrobium sp. SH527 TaxID=3448123 RepID=UPI003F5B3AA1